MLLWWQPETTLVTLLNSSMCWKRMPLLCSNFVFASGARFAIVFVSSEYKQYRYLQQSQRYIFVILSLYVCKKLKKCKERGKRFTVSMSLKKHVLTHVGKMHFECQECGPGFSQKGTLKIHMQNHTGEKPIYVSSAERGFQSVLCWRNIYRPILERGSMYILWAWGRLFKEQQVDEAYQQAQGEAPLSEKSLALDFHRQGVCRIWWP